MPNVSRPMKHVTVVILALGLSSIVAACDGDDATTPAESEGSPDGGTAPVDATTPPPSDGATNGDPADPDGGAGDPIEGDGDLPDLDPDAGESDAAAPTPECPAITPGPYVASTCSSRLASLTNVGLASATYELVSVRVLGNATFCSGTFRVLEHAGAIVVEASSPTAAKLRFFERYRSPGTTRAAVTQRWTANVTADAGVLTFAPNATCVVGSQLPRSAAFGTAVGPDGKKSLTLRLPYGASGSAIYRFVER